jgi:CBS domain-containing protein
MKLEAIFPKKVITGEPQENLAVIAARMQEHDVGTIVVVEGSLPVGIVTDRDLALALGARGIPLDTSVEKVMSRGLKTIGQDVGILGVTRYMRDFGLRRLPIVDGEGKLVGIVSADDVLQFLGRELFNVSEAIRCEIPVR